MNTLPNTQSQKDVDSFSDFILQAANDSISRSDNAWNTNISPLAVRRSQSSSEDRSKALNRFSKSLLQSDFISTKKVWANARVSVRFYKKRSWINCDSSVKNPVSSSTTWKNVKRLREQSATQKEEGGGRTLGYRILKVLRMGRLEYRFCRIIKGIL